MSVRRCRRPCVPSRKEAGGDTKHGCHVTFPGITHQTTSELIRFHVVQKHFKPDTLSDAQLLLPGVASDHLLLILGEPAPNTDASEAAPATPSAAGEDASWAHIQRRWSRHPRARRSRSCTSPRRSTGRT